MGPKNLLSVVQRLCLDKYTIFMTFPLFVFQVTDSLRLVIFLFSKVVNINHDILVQRIKKMTEHLMFFLVSTTFFFLQKCF